MQLGLTLDYLNILRFEHYKAVKMFSVCDSVTDNVTPVTGYRSLFVIFTALLCLKVLDSSASPIVTFSFAAPFQVFLFFFFLPVTISFFF